MKKTLYILRHAKAERGRASQEDHDRELAERGGGDAQVMGQYLAKHGIKPDKVLCSTSVRTRQTLAALPFEGEYSDKLYLASSGEILNLAAKTPETVKSLMIIGHNPGLHELCFKLARDGDPALLGQLAAKFPTCALATITFNGEWRNIAHVRGTLVDFKH